MTFELGITVNQPEWLEDATSCSADIVQFTIGDPRSWKTPKLSDGMEPRQLREQAEKQGIGIYVHAPYVVNLASANNRIRIPSRKVLQQHVTLASEIGARAVIVHGGHVTANDDPEQGYLNWFKAIDGLELTCPVLLENTAGGAHAMARYLSSIDKLWQAISKASGFDQVGFCLDTCHAHASGEDLDDIVTRIRQITGRIDLIHLNDSRDAAGSGADRHAHLGEGRIAPDTLVRIVQQTDTPTLLETGGGAAGQSKDMEWLRQRL